MKSKIMATALALVMMLVVGCKIEIEHTDTNASMMPTGGIVMPSGKILISDFDSTTIRNFLIATEDLKDYHFIINTGGGSALNSTTMINRIEFLQNCGAHITTEIIGYGMSAGTFLFLMGDERIVHEGAVLMLHGAGVQQGYTRMNKKTACDAEGQEALCDFLTILDQNVIDLLRQKTLMTDKDIDSWMYFDDYNFMDSEEAFELRLATQYRYNEYYDFYGDYDEETRE